MSAYCTHLHVSCIVVVVFVPFLFACVVIFVCFMLVCASLSHYLTLIFGDMICLFSTMFISYSVCGRF